MYSRSIEISKLVYGFDELRANSTAIGDIMISAVKDAAYNSKEFMRILRSFQTHVLSKLFPKGLRVVTRSDYGRLHCHMAVALPFIITGFDWDSFDEAERWYKIYKASKSKDALYYYKYFTKRYRASMPKELKELNHQLRVKAKKYGFGHIFILPVKKNNDALKWYLVGNVPHKRHTRDKGVHFYSSWGIKTTGKIKVLTPKYNSYRIRLKLFCEGLHLNASNYNIVLRELLGNNWHWKCREYIKHIGLLPEGLYLPPSLQGAFNELKKTIKQHLIRTDQYEPRPRQ